MPRSAEPRGMMTAMARISGGDTALRRKQADSKQRITSMVKTESYKENLLESFLDGGDMDVFILALRAVAEAQGGRQHFRKDSNNEILRPVRRPLALRRCPKPPERAESPPQLKELPHLRRIYYARIPFTTLPAMPVNRASRPWNFTVRRLWSMPSTCSMVAWKSGTATAFSATA